MGVKGSEAADRLIAQGHPLEDRGDFEAALVLYRSALQVAPGYFRAQMNVGNALEQLDRIDEAIAAQRRAVECAPDYAPARFNLGRVLRMHGELDEAAIELCEALRLQPDLLPAAAVLADLYEDQSRFLDAEAAFAKALTIDPRHAATLFNFGMFLLRRHRVDEALGCLAQAKTSDPGLEDAESAILFATNLRGDADAVEVFQLHRRLGRAIQESAGEPYRTWSNPATPNRPLRIGYVSADFRAHPVGHLIGPVLRQHDGNLFESFCYSNRAERNEVSDALRGYSRQWLDIAGLDDESLAERIRLDGIDILVDLGGHTTSNRLRLFARHPAPIQVTWMGYLNTTGLTAMDYRICDRHTDPEGATEHLYTEHLIRMPHSQWCYVPWAGFEDVPLRHRQRRASITFGSFNQYAKISDECVDLWCQLLARVPDSSLLVLDVRNAPSRRHLVERFQRHGIDQARVRTRGRLGFGDYFSAVESVDIALDTLPYNGATTTFDTIWMGTPIVALRGERAISRGCYGILRELGLDELIAYDPEQYLEINTRLARSDAWRADLHDSLRPRLMESALTNTAQFVSDLEACYRQMWRTWCSQTAATRNA